MAVGVEDQVSVGLGPGQGGSLGGVFSLLVGTQVSLPQVEVGKIRCALVAAVKACLLPLLCSGEHVVVVICRVAFLEVLSEVFGGLGAWGVWGRPGAEKAL